MTCTTSEWSLLNECAFFSLLWSYGEILAFRTVNQPSIDVREVDPNFVVATLILLLETQRAVGDGKGACALAILCSEPSGFKNPHMSDHSPPGRHNGVGPGGTGKSVLTNASSKMPMGRGSLPDWRRDAAPLKSPATMSTCSCNSTVRTVSVNFFPIPRFLA